MQRRDLLKWGAGAAASAAAAAMNARGAAAQGLREDPPGCTACRAVDLHAHWEPEPYIKAMAEYGVDIKPDPRNYDLAARIKYMDAHGVQIHVLTLNSPPWRFLEPRIGARIAQVVNDAAIAAHKAYPDRFYGAVVMPIENPGLALKELNRVAGQPGIRAVHLITSHLGHDYLFEKDFEPIFARAAELGYPLLFHPVNELVIGHDRLERGFTRAKVLKRPFREQIRQFYFDTITFYPETLRFLIDFAGTDRVVIGTDNFQAMDVEPTWLLHQLKLPQADLERIVRGNALRLLQLT
jgi:predicted TIM-barrel fold metal-dependent hydrolase